MRCGPECGGTPASDKQSALLQNFARRRSSRWRTNIEKTGEDAYRLTMAVAERRIPGGCAVDATCRIEQAEQTIRKGSDNQIDRARVLEVRIQSPPAVSLRTIGSSAAEPIGNPGRRATQAAAPGPLRALPAWPKRSRRRDRPVSSLVEAGRGGLPHDPEATLPALYIAGRDMAPSVQLGAEKIRY